MNKNRQLENIESIDKIPTQYEKRTCTDVCCIYLGITFSVLLIILAAVFFNYKKFYQANFPADSDGNLCGIDKQMYPYVYFVNPPDISRRVCVASCPKKGDQSLKCIPTETVGCRFTNTTGFEVKYYETAPELTRSGYFCFPTDEALKQQILINSDLQNRNLLYNSLDTIILCFFVALGFSFAYMLAVQFFPQAMNYAAIALGSLVILACAICLFTYGASDSIFRIVIGCLLIFFIIVTAITFFKNRDSLKIHGIFLRFSTNFIRDRPLTLLYIPLFFAFLVGFVVIIVLEFTAFWSSGELTFNSKQDLFHKLAGSGPIVFTSFLGIQTIWGLAFIKMAFNFCVSGQAVLWYYQSKQSFCWPLKLLLCKHFGSVIGGSFIIGFFTILDFIFDLFKPDPDADPDSCYPKCYNKSWGQFSLFDLVRTDSMAYINLTGNPYCNSARYCQYLCNRSVIMDNSQSTSRVYRLCAHFLLGGILIIFALYVKGVISSYALIIIAINTIFISTLFISVHADATQAISIIFLADEELSRRDRNIQPKYDNKFSVEQNLDGFKLRQEIVKQVKQQRLRQYDKVKKQSR